MADGSEVRVEVAVLDQGGFCRFCRAWIAGGGLGDTGADGGARVLSWCCCRRGTERRLASFFCGEGGWKNRGTIEATIGLWFWESRETGGRERL